MLLDARLGEEGDVLEQEILGWEIRGGVMDRSYEGRCLSSLMYEFMASLVQWDAAALLHIIVGQKTCVRRAASEQGTYQLKIYV